MTDLHFRVGHMEDAERLIKAHHYSRRMAGNVQYVCTWHEPGGLFGDYGDAVAACTFSIPGTRWSQPVLELSRLVRAPHVAAPLTGFLSLACKMLRGRREGLVVSFADATQDHHGGIYQAASWSFSTYREPRQDGLMIDGVFVPGRSCNSRWGTSSPTRGTLRRRPGRTAHGRRQVPVLESLDQEWQGYGKKHRLDVDSLP